MLIISNLSFILSYNVLFQNILLIIENMKFFGEKFQNSIAHDGNDVAHRNSCIMIKIPYIILQYKFHAAKGYHTRVLAI